MTDIPIRIRYERLSKNFTAAEFACPDSCGFQSPDPVLVLALQALRDVLACPVVITSGCRCAAHNAAIGGATRSQHVTGKAADIRVPGMTPRQVYAAAAGLGLFKGFGVSDEGAGFVHLDVRDAPLVARWTYHNGSEAPWNEPKTA